MNLSDRAKLLRERFKAKGGVPWRGAVREKPTEPPRNRPCNPLGQLINSTLKRWVVLPNPAPDIVLRTKRNAGIPVLTRIAQKAPKKLVRRYRNAEALLAERAQR